jgi:pyruvate formate lyase activating enzyme
MLLKKALNQKKLSSSIIQCQTCAHFCKIKEGKFGICRTRINKKGILYALNYGYTAATNIDPIEKKPLYHFMPRTLTYSFCTRGCNFRCANCQNHELSQISSSTKSSKEQSSLLTNIQKNTAFPWGREITPKEIVKEAQKYNCPSISYTYTEPTVFLEYALETMRIAKKAGLKNVWVSNGFMSKQTLRLILPYLDAINIDIKSFNNTFYKRYCGAKLKPILENCQRIVKEKIWLEITTLIVPKLSDDELMLKQLALFIKEQLGLHIPWHLSAFSGNISWKLKYLPPTPLSKLQKIAKIGGEVGLKNIYLGNV